MDSSVFVIIAARNEGDRLGATLRALGESLPGAPVWICDDGSTDDTSQVALAKGARVVRNERSVGKGAAATRAARGALEHLRPPADAVALLCDADLGESVARLLPLLGTIRQGQADIAVATFSRRIGGGFGLAVWLARAMVFRRSGLRPRAPISGQRALRKAVLEDVLPFAEGFGMEIGMTIDAARAGYRLREIELDLEHRATGRTPAGFLHRGRQVLDFVRVYWERR